MTHSEPGQRSKMQYFGKLITVFNYFCKKRYLKYVTVLNIRKSLCIWQVLNMHRDAIMEGLWICQDSEYGRFLHWKHCTRFWIWLNNVLWQGSTYVWSTFHRVLNNPPVLNMPGLRIWQGCEYARVTQGAE